MHTKLHINKRNCSTKSQSSTHIRIITVNKVKRRRQCINSKPHSFEKVPILKINCVLSLYRSPGSCESKCKFRILIYFSTTNQIHWISFIHKTDPPVITFTRNSHEGTWLFTNVDTCRTFTPYSTITNKLKSLKKPEVWILPLQQNRENAILWSILDLLNTQVNKYF